MNLEIALSKETINISLKNNRELIDKITLNEKNNLSNILLTNIDHLIRQHKLSKNKIKDISVKSDLPDSYTSARIAKSIAKSFVFGKKAHRHLSKI